MLLECLTVNENKEYPHDSSYNAKIIPDDNILAEEELKKIFKKEQFLSLEPLGQFNLGFIIAKKESDLFVIDQHASDERNRFETLLKECKMESQPLMQSLDLRLGAGGEQLVIDNLEVFERCGFKFELRDSDGSHGRIFLTASSSRNGLVLGLSDLLEMIEILRNTTEVNILPSKIKAAVASNACRSAIMIGRCLSSVEMTQVIRNMANLKDPWICAHGRPTMRHLCSIVAI